MANPDNNNIFTVDGGNVTGSFNPKQAFETLSNAQDKDRTLLFGIMAGVVIFVVVTFWIELLSMNRTYEQDKTALLQNNQQNKDYFDKVLLLNNEIQDFNTQLEVLKAKNSYLK